MGALKVSVGDIVALMPGAGEEEEAEDMPSAEGEAQQALEAPMGLIQAMWQSPTGERYVAACT